jgi:hypothetical protein
MDDQQEPNMTIYKEIGESIIAAKKRILATEREPAKIYSDDSDPEEYYTAQLNATGVKKGFKPAPTMISPIMETPSTWTQGADMDTVPQETTYHETSTPNYASHQEVQDTTGDSPEPPVESMRLDYLLFWDGFQKWEKQERTEAIHRFLYADLMSMKKRIVLFENVLQHSREKTLWETAEGIQAITKWIGAFRYWDMPPSWREVMKPQLYVRDLPRLEPL